MRQVHDFFVFASAAEKGAGRAELWISKTNVVSIDGQNVEMKANQLFQIFAQRLKSAHHNHDHNGMYTKEYLKTDKRRYTISVAQEGAKPIRGVVQRRRVKLPDFYSPREESGHHRYWMEMKRSLASLRRPRMRWLDHFAGFLGGTFQAQPDQPLALEPLRTEPRCLQHAAHKTRTTIAFTRNKKPQEKLWEWTPYHQKRTVLLLGRSLKCLLAPLHHKSVLWIEEPLVWRGSFICNNHRDVSLADAGCQDCHSTLRTLIFAPLEKGSTPKAV